MAAELAGTTLNDSGSVNVEAQQQGHLLDVASSSSSNDSKIRYNVYLKLPPVREEELLSDAQEREKWYHSFVSGGKRTGVDSDKDPRIQHAWLIGRRLGFSALLTREEALALKDYHGFFYARPSIAYPSPRSRCRPEKYNNEPIMIRQIDIEEYICASDEIKEQMMAGPRQREKTRMEKLSQLNTSSRLV